MFLLLLLLLSGGRAVAEQAPIDSPAVYSEEGRLFVYEKGTWFPWWAVLMVPFLTTLWLFVRIAGPRVNWKAAWATVLVFEAVVTPAEMFSVARGHWVYNKARILGPTLLNVPIEEHLLYYLFGPLVVITVHHAIGMGLQRLRE